MTLDSAAWRAIINQVLDDLGGKNAYVPGAKLHFQVTVRGLRDGADFRQHLLLSGTTFRQFLAETPSIALYTMPPPRTDMLVGFEGAQLPTPASAGSARLRTQRLRLRPDVYSAFTRISAAPFYYLPEADIFTKEPEGSSDKRIDVPSLALEDLMSHREEFTATVQGAQTKAALELALHRSPNPLAAFQRTVTTMGIAGQWHEFNFNLIKKNVEDWAASKDVTPQEAWFSQSLVEPGPDTPQRILSILSRHMSDDEIRALPIPFSAVEEFFRSLPRGHQPD